MVHIDLQDVGLSLTVKFKRFHLDIVWNKVGKQPKDSHGLIGELNFKVATSHAGKFLDDLASH